MLDADTDDQFADLVQLAKTVDQDDMPAYLETSRRGGHMWLFFAQAVRGGLAREFGQGLLAAHEIDNVELFPKQDSVTNGPGSLIRMPFGVHRLTSQRYGFITPDGELLAPTIREQIDTLRAPETVPEAAFDAYRSFVLSSEVKVPRELSDASTDTVSERIKARVTVMEFVSRYVDLKPTATGAVGLCPFHQDEHPSFGINEDGNYWNVRRKAARMIVHDAPQVKDGPARSAD